MVSGCLYQGQKNIVDIQKDLTFHFKRLSWSKLENVRIVCNSIFRMIVREEHVQLHILNFSALTQKSLSKLIQLVITPKRITGFVE